MTINTLNPGKTVGSYAMWVNAYRANLCTDLFKIADVSIIVPNKVVEVTFSDYTKEKMVLQEPDVFDLEQALYVALGKKLYRKDYTYEGIEYMTEQLKYQKKYVKIVETGMKLYKRKTDEMLILEAEQEHIAKKRAKRSEYKRRKAKNKKEEQIAMMKEAYIRASEYLKKEV